MGPQNANLDGLLTPQQLGEILHLRPEVVVRYAREGKLPHLRLSNKMIRFRLNEVVEALEHHV